jgi:hypothetical protein
MNKRAILRMERKDEKGRSYNLLLSLQEFNTTEGTQWQWHLPTHLGYGREHSGVFTKTFTQNNIIICLNRNSDDAIVIHGIVPRTFGEFPFSPSDYTNKLTSFLEVKRSNYFLQVGSYNWSLYAVIP